MGHTHVTLGPNCGELRERIVIACCFVPMQAVNIDPRANQVSFFVRDMSADYIKTRLEETFNRPLDEQPPDTRGRVFRVREEILTVEGR